MAGGASRVLQVGDPRLRANAAVVSDFNDPAFPGDGDELMNELVLFRKAYGFGRAIAAPQLGMPHRMIAIDLGDGPFLMVNPEIVHHSEETFTLWDDCMSFPWLLVKVPRFASISVQWQDGTGTPQEWKVDRFDHAELLQHEIDHLDGILSFDRMQDPHAIISRKVYEQDPAFFDKQVTRPDLT